MHLGGDDERKSTAESRGEQGKRPEAFPPPRNNDDTEENRENRKRQHRSIQHGTAAVHDESVVKDVEEAQEEREQVFACEQEERQEEQGGGEPSQEYGEKSVAGKRKVFREILTVIRSQKLIIILVGVDEHFTQPDEELAQRWMKLHVKDPIELFLCIGNIVVFIPVRTIGLGIAMQIRKVGKEAHHTEVQPSLSAESDGR